MGFSFYCCGGRGPRVPACADEKGHGLVLRRQVVFEEGGEHGHAWVHWVGGWVCGWRGGRVDGWVWGLPRSLNAREGPWKSSAMYIRGQEKEEEEEASVWSRWVGGWLEEKGGVYNPYLLLKGRREGA